MTITEHEYNWSYGATYRQTTDMIVLHHAAAPTASPDDIHRWHLAQGWRGIAYHFYIRKDGSIHRGREENAQGGHTLNYNATSVGVCFEGNFENESMGSAQTNAGRELLTYLQEKYGAVSIKKHSELNATACPGKNFPFQEITQSGSPDPEPLPIDDEWGRKMALYLSELSEIPGSEWSKAECEWAVEKGLFIGNDAGWMSWKSFPTREELAIIMYRFFKMLKD